VRDETLLVALVCRFGDRSITFVAQGDDDTTTVEDGVSLPRVADGDPVLVLSDVSESVPWSDFRGCQVRWGREMMNHQGYVDGYHLEFNSGRGAIGDGIEIIVAASELHIGTTWFSPADTPEADS
jgi:Family of unknown function (DUF6334)